MEEHHKTEHHAHKKESIKIKKTDLWISATTILAILLIISLYFNIKGGGSGGVVLPQNVVSEKAINFINTNLMQPGTSANVISTSEKNNLYNIKLDVGGRTYDSYATKDGKLLFPSAIEMDAETEAPEEEEEVVPSKVEKSDKPKVELFVMSHCPYGTQAEKGIIPVVELLGDKIDFDVKYINYAMHGEKEVKEQLRQYCINTEQKEKFLPYLKCFLKDGNSEACLAETKVDKTKLEACEKAKDEEFKITESLKNPSGSFPAFLVYDADCKKYGVRGSPSLVINGKSVSSGRSPAAFLATICAAFNEAPEECNEKLSGSTPSPGFGYEETVSATAASCG